MDRGFIEFDNVFIKNESSLVGKKEYDGPLSVYFDHHDDDEYFGMKSFEDAESEMIRRNLNFLAAKENITFDEIDIMFGGDLLNQCVAASFAVSDSEIPYFGLYGACSTIVEALIAGAVFIKSESVKNALSFASSHFCSSERQYRFPLEYGSLRTPTSQNTVTGTGAYLLSNAKGKIRIREALVGRIVDKKITDANNMGAAMAPAAVDTIKRYFENTKLKPDDFDYVITGDLGAEGHSIAKTLLKREMIELGEKYTDCGKIIYDADAQDTHSGGSGAGCLSSVLCGYFLKEMRNNSINRVLAVGTGALLNVNSVLQKKTIPSVAHAICIERVDE